MLGDLQLIHTSKRKMRCVFHTLVVRRDALKEKYSGGVKAFAEKHGARCNNDLAIICAMSGGDLDEAILYLKRSGFVSGQDYICFHALTFIPSEILDEIMGSSGEMDFGTDWLRGHPHNGGVMVYYVGEECLEEDE